MCNGLSCSTELCCPCDMHLPNHAFLVQLPHGQSRNKKVRDSRDCGFNDWLLFPGSSWYCRDKKTLQWQPISILNSSWPAEQVRLSDFRSIYWTLRIITQRSPPDDGAHPDRACALHNPGSGFFFHVTVTESYSVLPARFLNLAHHTSYRPLPYDLPDDIDSFDLLYVEFHSWKRSEWLWLLLKSDC